MQIDPEFELLTACGHIVADDIPTNEGCVWCPRCTQEVEFWRERID